MFTGLVEDTGSFLSRSGDRFTFSAPEKIIGALEKGSSVSVNGACLTVVELAESGGRFSVDVSRETRQETTLGSFRSGDCVNLELPLEISGLSGRLDGHLVQGHVDTTGRIGRIKRQGKNREVRVATDRSYGKYLADKGSVTVDGISLTPYHVTGGTFTVTVIPHTYENTNLKEKRSGSRVNIEFDVLAKYASKILGEKRA